MNTVKEQLANIHFEHLLWFNELNFFQKEINIFENRIAEIWRDFFNEKMLAELEAIQDQFAPVKAMIEKISNHLKDHETHIAEMAKLNGSLTNISDGDHETTRTEMNQLKIAMQKSEVDFLRFLEKWMG